MASTADSAAPPRMLELLLGGPLTVTLGGLCAVMLALWLPHYLTWPWWADLDSFAAIAQGWDAAIRPYRDVAVFNFPGQIELLWLLGKCFGWGRTAPLYALDATLLVVLGLTLASWSGRIFARAAPGLVGYVGFLHYYLGLDYAVVAQRDWQGPLLVMLGILLVQARPGQAPALGAGLLYGLGFVVRPHVLLFAPAVILAIVLSSHRNPEAGDEPNRRRRAAIGAVLAWILGAALGAAAGFAPLVAQGLLRDFVRGVRQASYGRYGEYPSSFASKVIGQLADPQIALGCLLAAATFVIASQRMRRLALPWALMLFLVLVYRPLHPLPHAYLAHPLWLIWSVNLALSCGAVMELWRRRPALLLGTIVLLLAVASPGVPRFCDLGASMRALGELLQPTEPALAPPGAATHFAPGDSHSPYTWEQYREVLDYLRKRTGPRTQVANLLRNVPFPGVNGTLGRISPLRADSGVIWLYAFGADREAQFASDLEAADDAVVVWIPGEHSFDPRLELPILERAVPKHYFPEAKLRGIQVWRRKPPPR